MTYTMEPKNTQTVTVHIGGRERVWDQENEEGSLDGETRAEWKGRKITIAPQIHTGGITPSILDQVTGLLFAGTALGLSVALGILGVRVGDVSTIKSALDDSVKVFTTFRNMFNPTY